MIGVTLASAEPSGKIVFRSAAFFFNTLCISPAIRYSPLTVSCSSFNDIEVERVNFISFVVHAGNDCFVVRSEPQPIPSIRVIA